MAPTGPKDLYVIKKHALESARQRGCAKDPKQVRAASSHLSSYAQHVLGPRRRKAIVGRNHHTRFAKVFLWQELAWMLPPLNVKKTKEEEKVR